MSRVFISYSSENRALVSGLADGLKDAGHEVWFDRHVTGGHRWWDRLLEEILRCEVFVFALTSEALDSRPCKLERLYAQDLCKNVLPVLMSDGVAVHELPPDLQVLEYVDYRSQDAAAAYRLTGSLKALPPARALPDPLPPPPPFPPSDRGRLIELIDTPTPLSFEDQAKLILIIHDRIRDGDSQRARVLLRRLKRRDDIFAKIDKEIDWILAEPTRPSEPEILAASTRLPEAKILAAPTRLPEAKILAAPTRPPEPENLTLPKRWQKKLERLFTTLSSELKVPHRRKKIARVAAVLGSTVILSMVSFSVFHLLRDGGRRAPVVRAPAEEAAFPPGPLAAFLSELVPGDYVVIVGSYTSEEAARQEVRRIKCAHPELFSPQVRPRFSYSSSRFGEGVYPSGPYWVVYIGGAYSYESADRLRQKAVQELEMAADAFIKNPYTSETNGSATVDPTLPFAGDQSAVRAGPETALRVLDRYRIGIYFAASSPRMASLADVLRKKLVGYGFRPQQVGVYGKDDSFFQGLVPPEGLEIRYEPGFEDDAAAALQVVLSDVYPAKPFTRMPVGAGRTADFVSLFLGESGDAVPDGAR
jgi:hypothetical protein